MNGWVVALGVDGWSSYLGRGLLVEAGLAVCLLDVRWFRFVPGHQTLGFQPGRYLRPQRAEAAGSRRREGLLGSR